MSERSAGDAKVDGLNRYETCMISKGGEAAAKMSTLNKIGEFTFHERARRFDWPKTIGFS